jgi:hypothetical protein
MDRVWIWISVAVVVGIFTLRDVLRTKRHSRRNAAGQCGMCSKPLGWERVRQLSYRYSRFGPPETVNICQPCFIRRRVKLGLIWLLVLAIFGVILGLPALYPNP